MGLDQVKLLISTVHEFETNHFLADYLTQRNLEAIFICSADTPRQARRLYKAGATYVMLPHYIGGEKILNFIKKAGIDKQAFAQFRDHHLLSLQQQLAAADQLPKKPRGTKHPFKGRLTKPFKKKKP